MAGHPPYFGFCLCALKGLSQFRGQAKIIFEESYLIPDWIQPHHKSCTWLYPRLPEDATVRPRAFPLRKGLDVTLLRRCPTGSHYPLAKAAHGTIGCLESFSGKLRDELLNVEILDALLEVQVLVEQWRRKYNTVRPHSALNYRPPAPEEIRPWH